MATRVNKPISVTLGSLAVRVEERVASGHYESVSEVVREGLRALDREDEAWDEFCKQSIRRRLAEIEADPRPPVPMEEAFARVRAHAASSRAKRSL